jgi:hypothetical protein
LECVAIKPALVQNRSMSKAWWRALIIVAMAALLVSARQAVADGAYYGQPLTQASFDKLIPTSYPTATVRFDRLHQTTWPLIDPGVATVPITDNLIHPTDYPLLVPTEGVGPLHRVRSIQRTIPVLRPASGAQVSAASGKGEVKTRLEARRISSSPQY